MQLLALASEPTIWGIPRGDFFVAVGTMLLAGMTGALAYLTWRDLKDTRRLADLARLAHEARYEPFLVSTEPTNIELDAEGFILSLAYPIRNIGVGPALGVSAWVIAYSEDGTAGQRTENPWYSELILPESYDLATFDVSQLRTKDAFCLRVFGRYWDRTRDMGAIQFFPPDDAFDADALPRAHSAQPFRDPSST